MIRSNVWVPCVVFACSVLALAAFGCDSEQATTPDVQQPAEQPGTGAAGAAPQGAAPQQPAAPGTPSGQAPAQPQAGPNGPAQAEDMQPAAGAPAPSNTPTDPMTQKPVDPTQLDHTQDIRGHCGLATGYADDHACLVPPKPGEGIQIHVGPKNYDDPAEVAKFLMKPGEESSECYTIRTPNAEEVVYQTWTLSGRAGTHHIINTTYDGDLPEDVWGNCGGRSSTQAGTASAPTQNGNLPGASKAYMPRGEVAPEYAHVGRKLAASTLLQSDMHYFNFTDKDIIREYWINLYYAPAGKVTEYAEMLVGFGGTGWNEEPIPPGTDMVYKYECPFTGNGYLMNLLGHYHAHGKRFSSSIKRANGTIEKVFEMYDYLDPAVFDYNSVTQNPAFSASSSGAVSGQIAISEGDVLQWECHIVNDSDVALGYTNHVKTGEMCNIWGYTVGTDRLRCFLP